jgi:hypothetical protein
MPVDKSFFTRHAGGIFLWGISVLDAYKIARIEYEVGRKTGE